MAGISLGSAYFEFVATNSDLIAKSAQSEQVAKQAYDQIAQAAGVSAAAVERAAKSMAAATQAASDARAQAALKTIRADNDQAAAAAKAADASAQAALKTIRAYNDAADAAAKAAQKTATAHAQASSGFSEATKSALAFGAAVGGVTLGLGLLHEGLTKIVTDTQAANQAVFALQSTFQGTTKEMQAFAEANAKAAGQSKTAGDAALAETRILATQYGYTNDQIKEVVKRSADLAAVTGVDLVTATHDTTAALRLEGDVAEELGLNLQQNAIQASLATKAQREQYNALDPLTKSQITYQKFLEQSNFAQGEAAKRAGDTTGAFDKLNASITDLTVSIGQRLTPTLATGANAMADYIDGAQKAQTRNQELALSFEDLAKKYTSFLGVFSAVGFFEAVSGRTVGHAPPAAPSGPTNETGTRFGPDPGLVRDLQQEQKVREAAERDKQARIAEIRKEARADEAKAGEEAAQAEHDRAIKSLDDQKTILDVEKDAKLKAVEANKDAALAGIEAEAKAAKEASDAHIASLHAEEQAAKQAASDRHDSEVSGIEAAQKAAEDATAENIHNLEIERDRSKQASEDKRDAAIKALDVEKQARDQARTQEDRQIQDSVQAAQRAEDARHQGVLRGLDDETKAADDKKDAALRGIQAEADAAEKAHQNQLRRLSDEADAAHKKHDDAASALDDEGRQAADQHDATMQRLSDEADAVKAAADAAQRIRDTAHEQALRNLDAEADADRAAAEQASRVLDAQYQTDSRGRDTTHQAAVDGFEAEAEAAKAAAEQISRVRDAAHEQVLREIDQESDAAHDAHDQALAEIERQKTAEDDRHRAAMAAIDAEEQNRQDAVDAQIAALDKLDQADQQAAQDKTLQGNVTSARFGVLKAQSSGNLSEIVKAQQDLDAALAAIDRTKAQRDRDTQRDTLKAQKDAIKEEADAQKAAEDALNLQRQREIAAAKDAADATLKATLDGLAGRKQAEQDTYAAAVQFAKDALDKQLADIDRRKKAESDAYALAKQQAQDAYDAAKQAAADALQKQLDDIAKRKQAETDIYDAVKLAASDALKIQLDGIDRRKRAEDDAYKAGQDRRAAEKRDLDDALAKQLDRISKQKQADDDAYANAKDKLDKRKVAVGDANKDELEKIAARKTAENDAHDNAVLKAADQTTQEKRAVQDRRTAEDVADQAKRQQIQEAFTNEERDRHARYDDEATGEIPALHRALVAAQEHFRERKTAADTQYQSETHQIDDTYNHPEHGLIPLAQKAAAAVATGFQNQTKSVNEEAGRQKAAINDEYSNPGKTGLLDLIEQARQDTDQKLKDQRTYWEDWKEDLAGPEGKIKKVIGDFNDLINKIKEAGGTISRPAGDTGQQHGPADPFPGGGNEHDTPGGGGPGPNVGSDGAPEPYAVSFPFGARYSNPFNNEIPIHRGVDMVVKGAPNGGEGSPVSAFEDGTVVYDSYDPNGGNGIIIRGQDGLYHRYFHFDSTDVNVGQQIHRGQTIGTLGQTGTEGSPHLHYEVSHAVNGDPIDQLINPMPYLAHGSGGAGGGQDFEFDLFGRHFKFHLPFGTPAGDVGKWIAQALQLAGLPSEWLEPMEQIAAAESGQRNADGSVVIGTGNVRAINPEDVDGEHASGLLQMLPSTFERWRLQAFPDDILNGLSNAASSARYIENTYGDPRNTDYFRDGGFDWRGVQGYADGYLFREPTLTVGLTSGERGIIGETGQPERLLGVADTRSFADAQAVAMAARPISEAMGMISRPLVPQIAAAAVSPYGGGAGAMLSPVPAGGFSAGAGGPIEHMPVNLILNNQIMQQAWITGYQLHARRGSLPGSFGALA